MMDTAAAAKQRQQRWRRATTFGGGNHINSKSNADPRGARGMEEGCGHFKEKENKVKNTGGGRCQDNGGVSEGQEEGRPETRV